MKIRLTFKNPEAAADAVLIDGPRLDADEKFELVDRAGEPWLRWGEYVTIEIDTEANTARVVRVDHLSTTAWTDDVPDELRARGWERIPIGWSVALLLAIRSTDRPILEAGRVVDFVPR